MERRGRRAKPIELEENELDYLNSLPRSRKLPSGEARRARALLMMRQEGGNKAIAQKVGEVYGTSRTPH